MEYWPLVLLMSHILLIYFFSESQINNKYTNRKIYTFEDYNYQNVVWNYVNHALSLTSFCYNNSDLELAIISTHYVSNNYSQYLNLVFLFNVYQSLGLLEYDKYYPTVIIKYSLALNDTKILSIVVVAVFCSFYKMQLYR